MEPEFVMVAKVVCSGDGMLADALMPSVFLSPREARYRYSLKLLF
jgi:hypothetical protein